LVRSKMIPNPTQKGKRTEAAILRVRVELGKSVLIPWGEERFDLVVYEANRFQRIQCKTGTLRRGCLRLDTPLNGQVERIRWARNYEIGELEETELIDFGVFTPTASER
jgi:hypothetical protein